MLTQRTLYGSCSRTPAHAGKNRSRAGGKQLGVWDSITLHGINVNLALCHRTCLLSFCISETCSVLHARPHMRTHTHIHCASNQSQAVCPQGPAVPCLVPSTSLEGLLPSDYTAAVNASPTFVGSWRADEVWLVWH